MKQPDNKTAQLKIRVTQEVKEWLEHQATQDERSMNYVVNAALQARMKAANEAEQAAYERGHLGKRLGNTKQLPTVPNNTQ